MKKAVGIFGGSFDPIHFGHINLAVEMMEAHRLDEVWFCPAARNPLKPLNSVVNDEHRLTMINLAIEKEPRFSTTDVDITRDGPSYTVDTLRCLLERETKNGRETSFSLILGLDAANSFHLWKDPDLIIKLAKVLVGGRTEKTVESFQGTVQVVDALKEGMTKTRIMEISSTDIRDRLYHKKYCGHLVPGKVLDYIFLNGLYYTA